MDAAIDQLQVATNTEQIQAALAEIWRVWQQSWPSAITESVQELIILKPEVKGVIATQVSALLFHDAYIDEG